MYRLHQFLTLVASLSVEAVGSGQDGVPPGGMSLHDPEPSMDPTISGRGLTPPGGMAAVRGVCGYAVLPPGGNARPRHGPRAAQNGPARPARGRAMGVLVPPMGGLPIAPAHAGPPMGRPLAQK